MNNQLEARMVLISTLVATHIVRLTLYKDDKGELCRAVHVSRALDQKNFVMAVLFVLTFSKNIPELSTNFDPKSEIRNKLLKQQDVAIETDKKTPNPSKVRMPLRSSESVNPEQNDQTEQHEQSGEEQDGKIN